MWVWGHFLNHILDHIQCFSKILTFVFRGEVEKEGGPVREGCAGGDALIDGFAAAGNPGASLNAARCSSDPLFGLLGRNPNAYEVSARLEVEARSEGHPQLLAAAADGHEKRATKSVSGLNCAP